MQYHSLRLVAALASVTLAVPAMAQDTSSEDDEVNVSQGPVDMSETVYDGDYLSVGVGAAVSSSYTGSDDYVVSVLPFAQGSLGGIGISPRAGGLKLDFIPDGEGKVDLSLGVAGRLRNNRTGQIEDEIVKQYGELDGAIEVGPSVGVSINQVLNPYDSLSFSTDIMLDAAGAHEGLVVSPGISYFTPLSRGMAGALSIGAEWADEDFHDYNFGVDPSAYIGPGVSPLTPFDPDGGGFTNVGANLFLGIDLDGDLANGGLALVLLGGYSRLLGDAADTPFTTERGSKDQFTGAVGLAYTF
ncbi:MAG: MipA/OmpV family protein [Alteraurantiacibacter sp. bin_em_oilr2.035]|nr:MipA/OmpV family protein [Aurantiacibacter atlanticus]MDF1835580.1 MipA/OmpV family protein [Alteraurantiacibacter sp. bin_em_oilr2.035]